MTASSEVSCQGWMANRTQRSPSRSMTFTSKACSADVRAPVSILALTQGTPQSGSATHSRQPTVMRGGRWRVVVMALRD